MRRHLDFVVGPGDVANQRTAAAVAGKDIDAFLPALQRGFPIIEAKMTFGPFRSMATDTGLFQDGLDVPVEINLDAGWRRQRNAGNFRSLVPRAKEQDQK